MNKAISITVSACCLVITSCASKPMTQGDSTVQQKTVSFPKQGQQVHALVGGLVHLKADYKNRYVYRLVLPLSMGFMLGKVVVSTQEMLTQSSLDGEDVFCTTSKVYSDPLTGPLTIACFQSADKGIFTNIKVAPGLIWFNKQLSPQVDYVGSEIAFSSGGKPLKRELIFDGVQNDTLLFSEKIYEHSVEAASKTKPLMTKVATIPMKVTLDGVEINIINYGSNSLTYTIEKPWD